MTEVTNELMYSVLKQIQATLAEIKSTQVEHSRLLVRVREDINTLRSDDLRLESMQAQMDVRLERR
jgi:hypothetical protein